MKIDRQLTDEATLREIGERLVQRRLDLRLTQAELAEQSGLSKRTIENLESGHSTQMSSLIRVLRGLDQLEGLNNIIPESTVRPMDLLKLKGKARQRVSRRKPATESENKWQWGDGK